MDACFELWEVSCGINAGAHVDYAANACFGIAEEVECLVCVFGAVDVGKYVGIVENG